MELIGIELSEFSRRSRSILLNHADLALDILLCEGERVVLWGPLSGDYHSGTVVDVHLDGTEVQYRMEVGIRLPEELALDRITEMSSTSARLSNQDIVDLLGKLRAATMPTLNPGLSPSRAVDG